MGISTMLKGGAAKAGPALSSAGKAAAPVLGKVAGKVGGAVSAGGSAVQGALWGAGATVSEKLMNLLTQQSFLLFLIGLVHFFFLRTTDGATNYSTLLMFI